MRPDLHVHRTERGHARTCSAVMSVRGVGLTPGHGHRTDGRTAVSVVVLAPGWSLWVEAGARLICPGEQLDGLLDHQALEDLVRAAERCASPTRERHNRDRELPTHDRRSRDHSPARLHPTC